MGHLSVSVYLQTLRNHLVAQLAEHLRFGFTNLDSLLSPT